MMTNSTVNKVASIFGNIPDPRDPRRITYPLENILTIAVCAVIAGCDGWEEFEDFGEAKEEIFSSFLDMSAGPPKHDVYRRVFNGIHPESFQNIFLTWTKSILGEKLMGQVAIDGKCMRGSGNKIDERSPLHMVSAWACDHSIVFSQRTIDEKSNEITAIPKILDGIPLVNTLVSIDAMGCQYEIAEKIIAGDGSYLFSLKGNQGNLHKDIREYVEDARTRDYTDMPHESATTEEKNRGRKEVRTVRVLSDIEWLEGRHKNWGHIQTVLMIERTRGTSSNSEQEIFYYISNKKMTPQEWLVAIRKHWQVENNLHWVLDVTFSEDASHIHNVNGAENISILRRIALNILKNDTTQKASIRRKRKIAGWRDKALIEFLKQM